MDIRLIMVMGGKKNIGIFDVGILEFVGLRNFG